MSQVIDTVMLKATSPVSYHSDIFNAYLPSLVISSIGMAFPWMVPGFHVNGAHAATCDPGRHYSSVRSAVTPGGWSVSQLPDLPAELNMVPSYASSLTLGALSSLLLLLPLKCPTNKSICLIQSVWGLIGVIYVKHLEQRLTHSKCLMDVIITLVWAELCACLPLLRLTRNLHIYRWWLR